MQLKFPFFTLVFFLISIVSFIYFGYSHELVHQAVFKNYGINSTIHTFSRFPNMVTSPDQNCPNDFCKLANLQNEAFSYPLLPLFTIIIFGFSFIILLLEEFLYITIGYLKSSQPINQHKYM